MVHILKYYLDINEEDDVVYIPEFAVKRIIESCKNEKVVELLKYYLENYTLNETVYVGGKSVQMMIEELEA